MLHIASIVMCKSQEHPSLCFAWKCKIACSNLLKHTQKYMEMQGIIIQGQTTIFAMITCFLQHSLNTLRQLSCDFFSCNLHELFSRHLEWYSKALPLLRCLYFKEFTATVVLNWHWHRIQLNYLDFGHFLFHFSSRWSHTAWTMSRVGLWGGQAMTDSVPLCFFGWFKIWPDSSAFIIPSVLIRPPPTY